VPEPSPGLISGGGSRRRLGAGLALVVTVAVVIAVIVATGSPSPAKTASDAGGVSGAATVRRRDLVQTDTESGTLTYSDPQTVYNRLTGTITWLPRVGQEIKPGATLYEIDGEPVILMDGTTPAYRTLAPGINDGADVLELNRNLVKLGFNPDGIVIDDVWQPATTIAVEVFQESLGEVPTGSLALGQIQFLPGDQLISTVDGTLGAAGSGGGSAATPAAGSSDASTAVVAAEPEFASLETVKKASTGAAWYPSTTVPDSTVAAPRRPAGVGRRGHRNHSAGRQTLAALIALLKAEVAELKAQRSASSAGHGAGAQTGSGASGAGKPASSATGGSPGSGSGSPASSGGSGGGSAQAILETTSTRLAVTVDLGASVQKEAVVGEHVTVEMPAGNTVNGKITAVSPVAQNSSGSGSGGGTSGSPGGGGGGGGGGAGPSSSSSTVPVTITLSGHHSGAGLDQAAVSVNFAQQRANHVLSVPVTALLATSGGNYAVQEAGAPRQLIPVTTGLFAAGYVQVSGSGVHPGLRVTDSQG
jgi:hypothetical protein